MVSAWRKSKKDETASLLSGQRNSSYSKPMKKKGVFSKLRKPNQYERTPPVTPDEKYDVAVVASEYDPSRFYAPTGPKAVSPYPATQIRKVEFKESAMPPALFSESYPVSSPEPYTSSAASSPPPMMYSSIASPSIAASTAPSTPAEKEKTNVKPCATSMFGFIDDICQIPRRGDTGGSVNADGTTTANQWGTVPSYDEEESTYPSLPSTTDGPSTAYSRSVMNSYAQDSSYGGGHRSNDIPSIEEAPSHDHENFEVVLDSSLLSSPPNSPKRKSWFKSNEEAAPKTLEGMESGKTQDSKRGLVRRLFSGRKKKQDPPAQLQQEQYEDDQYHEEDEQPQEEPMEEEYAEEEQAIFIPEMEENPKEPLPGRETQLEPSPLEHARSAPPALAAGPYEESAQAPAEPGPGAADDILSALGNILSALDPLGGMYEEEKKEEEPVLEESQPQTEKSFEDLLDDVGPDDETEDNRTPVPGSRENVQRERSKSFDEIPENIKTEKVSRRTLSFGGLAKKISKPFAKKNKDISPSDPPAVAAAPSALASTAAAAAAADGPKDVKKKKAKKDKPLWKSTVDPNTGRTYWYNRITRESTYNPPPEAFESKPKPVPSENTPVAEPSTPKKKKKQTQKQKPLWKPVVDKNSGRTYFYHRKTRETTWIMPEELKQLELEKAQQEEAAPLGKNDTTKSQEGGDDTTNGEGRAPPMVVEAEMTEESQARISKGERGLLGTSFDVEADQGMHEQGNVDPALADKRKEIQRLLNSLSPPESSSVDQLMEEYAGRENVLVAQLREKVEARPFDEPMVEVGAIPKPSPSRLTGRTTTFMSKSSAATRSSNITDKTERIRNTRIGKSRIEPISETMSTTTSISSHRGDTFDISSTPPRSGAVPRERELKVEELTNSRVAAETFDKPGRVVRSRGSTTDELDEGSYYGDDEVNTYGTDSVSALSENDAEFSNRKDNFEQARRRALDDAIEREDWDLAAALSEGMRATNTLGDYAKAHSTWNQSDLDKFIANNDWDAVKSYIARMRDAKKEGHDVAPPPITKSQSAQSDSVLRAPSRKEAPPTIGKSQSFSKSVGARSQLQHKNFMSDSSWTSEEPSYDSGTDEEESYDSDYS